MEAALVWGSLYCYLGPASLVSSAGEIVHGNPGEPKGKSTSETDSKEIGKTSK